MMHPKLLPTFCACALAAVLAASPAAAQQPPADREDTALAYAQCMRDNGFTEFEDPTPDGDLRIQVTPESAPRFRAAGEACRDLAPAGFRDESVTPEELEALIKLSQCVRENGLPDFPDPSADGRFNLRATGLGPGDTRLEAAMDACSDLRQSAGRIIIGG
jgi:hypothetical protein